MTRGAAQCRRERQRASATNVQSMKSISLKLYTRRSGEQLNLGAVHQRLFLFLSWFFQASAPLVFSPCNVYHKQVDMHDLRHMSLLVHAERLRLSRATMCVCMSSTACIPGLSIGPLRLELRENRKHASGLRKILSTSEERNLLSCSRVVLMLRCRGSATSSMELKKSGRHLLDLTQGDAVQGYNQHQRYPGEPCVYC